LKVTKYLHEQHFGWLHSFRDSVYNRPETTKKLLEDYWKRGSTELYFM